MRFEYEHITQVLPYLFKENDENKAFKKKGGSGEELIKMYQEQVSDIHFRKFYDRLCKFQQ